MAFAPRRFSCSRRGLHSRHPVQKQGEKDWSAYVDYAVPGDTSVRVARVGAAGGVYTGRIYTGRRACGVAYLWNRQIYTFYLTYLK